MGHYAGTLCGMPTHQWDGRTVSHSAQPRADRAPPGTAPEDLAGSPEPVLRAVELGLPIFLGILGGTAGHRVQYGRAYRQAWAEVGHPTEQADIAVAVHGFVADDHRRAEATYLEHELRRFTTGAAEVGRPGIPPTGREADYEAGGPDEIADRILQQHQVDSLLWEPIGGDAGPARCVATTSSFALAATSSRGGPVCQGVVRRGRLVIASVRGCARN